MDHGARLRRVLRAAADPGVADPVVVVLTPGPDSAAWVEHYLLARWAGLPLVTDADLVVRGTSLFLRDGAGDGARAGGGERRVHVVHRRVDDEELDPLEPGGDPAHVVPGLMGVVRAGGVVPANAAGNGVADDKGVCTAVPDLVRYHLGEAPLLPNVETARCWVPEERADALGRMAELVVEPVQGYGGRRSSSAPRRPPGSSPSCVTGSWRTPAAGSPSRCWTCPRCRPRSVTPSSPGRSTCARSCWTVPRPPSCRGR